MVIRLGKDGRKKPSGVLQRKILARQGGCCFYCRLEFGSTFEHGIRLEFVELVWDHLLPFCYSGNNQAENFVAACKICNGLKSGKVFDSIKDIQDYVRNKRKKRGYPVSGMRNKVSSEEGVAEVLLREMQERELLEMPQDSQVRTYRAIERSRYYRVRLLGLL